MRWLLAVTMALAPYGPAQVVCHLPPGIAESSGLASDSRSDGWFWTHQDSGDEARFYAVSTRCRLLATYRLPGVQARDWEDMARGTDPRGAPALFLADIGDNRASRSEGVVVHRVPEPPVDPHRHGLRVTTAPPLSWRLRYPDGPQDAETLLIDPRGGRLFLVTKSLTGTAGVYAAPQQLRTDAPNTLQRVAAVALHPTGTPGGPGIGPLAGLLVTAGDIAPDRSRVALRTYTDLYEWELGARDLATALRGTPTVTPLPPTPQGEGLAYSRDGSALLLSSEGVGTPVHLLRRRAAASTAPDPGQPTTTRRESRDVRAQAGVALVAATGGALLLARRRRRRAGR